MSNWGSANMHEDKKYKDGNKGNAKSSSGEKYLSLKTPAIGVNATFTVRFIGEPMKFFAHWVSKDQRKFCFKTLTAIDATTGQPIYRKQDPMGNLVPFSMEDIEKCPICMRGEEPKTRYASNVIDLNEAYKLSLEKKPPIVRIMEFPVSVYESIEYFINNHKILPNDLKYGPAFIIRLEYPKKSGLTAQDVRYTVDWTEPGSSPISDADWAFLSKKLHNLVYEYDPLRPGKQSLVSVDGNNNFSNYDPNINTTNNPSTQLHSQDVTVPTGFGASITGVAQSPIITPQPSTVIGGFVGAPSAAPIVQPTVTVPPPVSTAPIVQPQQPVVYTTVSIPSQTVAQPVAQAPQAPQAPQASFSFGVMPQQAQSVPPPINNPSAETSLLAEVDNVFSQLQPKQ